MIRSRIPVNYVSRGLKDIEFNPIAPLFRIRYLRYQLQMSQKAETRYWPDDEEVLNELVKMPIYRKVSRTRLRMVFEAIEDHRRGYRPGGREYAGTRVRRNTFWIEHRSLS